MVMRLDTIEKAVNEGFATDAVDLRLREGKDFDDIYPAGECGAGVRECGVVGGSGEDEPTRAQIAVELRLDGVEELGDVLILVDQYRAFASDESTRVGAHGGSRRGVIKVDHDTARAASNEG